MRKILLYLPLLLLFFKVNAQTPYLDLSFASSGREYFTISGTTKSMGLALDTSGNIYTGGINTTNNYTNASFLLTKSDPNGVLDLSFGTQGIVHSNFTAANNDYLHAIAIDHNQKIVAGGYTVGSGSTNILLARYNTDGTLDNTFGSNGFTITSIGSYAKIYSIAIQDDDKIVVAGVSKTVNSAVMVARYNINGTLDATFGNNGIDTMHLSAVSNDSAVAVKIQAGGKIVVAGMNGANNMVLYRFLTDGTLDNTFGVNGIRNFSNPMVGGLLVAMTLLPDGSIITTDSRTGSYSSVRPYIKKFSPSGAFDSTFNSYSSSNPIPKAWGVVLDMNPDPINTSVASVVNTLTATQDGGIIAAGGIMTYGGDYVGTAKLKANGQLDSTFGLNGKIVETFSTILHLQINSAAVQKDNKVLVVIRGGNTVATPTTFEVNRYFRIPLYLGKDTTICQGNSVTLNAGNPGSSYLWNTGATTQTITVTDSGKYSVRVTNALGYVTDTIHLAYFPSTNVQLGNDTAFCAGNTLVLDAANNGATYLWNTGATTQTISVAADGTYSVVVTDTNQCVGKDTIQVTVSTSPVVVNLGNDTAFCDGNSLTLNAQNNGATYLWNTMESSQSIQADTSGTYSVVVTDVNNCKGSDTVVVVVHPNPVVDLGNDTSFCAGNVLDADITGVSYLWNTGAQTETITVNTSGTYSVVVTDANQCSAADTIDVVAYPLPVVNLGNDTTAGNGSIITLDAGNIGASYLWNTGATSRTTNVINTGTYSVTVTDANGCSASDSITVTFEITGVGDVVRNGNVWTISPNPASNFITITVKNPKLINSEIVISDAYGRIMKQVLLKDLSQQISLAGLSAGTYFVKAADGFATIIVKE